MENEISIKFLNDYYKARISILNALFPYCPSIYTEKLFHEANEVSYRDFLLLKPIKCPIKGTREVFLDCRSNDSSTQLETGACYRKRTLSLGYSVKFSCYPRGLLSVAFHDVEVTEDGKADFHKKFKTEKGEDGKIDIGELLSKRPAFF